MVQARIRQWVSLNNLVWLGIVIIWLGAAAVIRPLTLPDEGRYVGVAWEMVTSGNWLVPHLDGLPYFHKPPLFYWITAASFKTFGPYLFCSRIASLLSAIVMALTLLWFLSRHLGKKSAVVAFAVLLTQPLFFASAQFANLDMLVACMIAVTIMMAAEFVWSLEKGQFKRRYLMATYLAVAAGILAKGLIGAVLPGAVIFCWLLASRRLSYLKSFFWWPAIVLFLVVVSPWFLLMEAQFKGFLNYFFIHHHFQRFAGTEFNNKQPFWFYLPALLLLTLPSSLWLLRFRLREVKQWSRSHQDLGLLMLCWIGFILLFFSIPVSKPLGYIIPVLPAVATITTMLIMQVWKTEQRSLRLTFAVAVVACLTIILIVTQHAKKGLTYQMAQHVAQIAGKDDQLVMLDKYQFDLPFYLRFSQPAWVVTDWQAASHTHLSDNWERELLEAKVFDQKTATKHLLSMPALAQQACHLQANQALWVVGDVASASHFAPLAHYQPLVNVRGHIIWRFSQAEFAGNCTAAAKTY